MAASKRRNGSAAGYEPWALPDSRPQKTSMLVAQRLVTEITDKRLAPGTSLPSEKEMLEEYGVARGTLRESLRYLESQGVITIRSGPYGGPVVSNGGARGLARVMALLLQLDGANFSVVLDAREVLEPATARLAAERAKPSDIAALMTSITDMEDRIGEMSPFLSENRKFHYLVARTSGNELFGLLQSSLSWMLDGFALGVEYDSARQRKIVEAHREVASAIGDGDPDAAEEKMSSHISEFSRYVGRHYRQVLSQPLRWDSSVNL